MTAFEAGFVKYAQEHGLTEEYAARVLKVALEHPESARVFKGVADDEDKHQTPDHMEILSEFLKHELLDKQMAHFSGETTKVHLL